MMVKSLILTCLSFSTLCERHGVCSVLLAVQPHTILCFVQVCEQRTSLDYAHFMAALVKAQMNIAPYVCQTTGKRAEVA